MLRLAIIVVLYQSRDEVAALWECLARQGFRDWRLIVLDNFAADGAGGFLAAQGDVRVSVTVNAGNEGFARAVNAGLRQAAALGAERCLLLNPDVAFTPDFLAELMARWDGTGADVIAPRIMLYDRPETSWYAGGGFDFGWTFVNRHDEYNADGPGSRIVEFASGCCLGLTMTALRRVGLLDESFFVYSEDVDFCLRLKSEGIPIQYVSDPFLLHHAGASSGGEHSTAAVPLYYSGYALLLRKHFPLVRAVQMIARTAAKEAGRSKRPVGHGRRVAAALLRGFFTRRMPVPRLPTVPE